MIILLLLLLVNIWLLELKIIDKIERELVLIVWIIWVFFKFYNLIILFLLLLVKNCLFGLMVIVLMILECFFKVCSNFLLFKF